MSKVLSRRRPAPRSVRPSPLTPEQWRQVGERFRDALIPYDRLPRVLRDIVKEHGLAQAYDTDLGPVIVTDRGRRVFGYNRERGMIVELRPEQLDIRA